MKEHIGQREFIMDVLQACQGNGLSMGEIRDLPAYKDFVRYNSPKAAQTKLRALQHVGLLYSSQNSGPNPILVTTRDGKKLLAP